MFGKFLSRFFGFFVGAIIGAISGIFCGIVYSFLTTDFQNRPPLDPNNPLSKIPEGRSPMMKVFLFFRCVIGGILRGIIGGMGEGMVQGLMHGLEEAIYSPKHVWTFYFQQLRENNAFLENFDEEGHLKEKKADESNAKDDVGNVRLEKVNPLQADELEKCSLLGVSDVTLNTRLTIYKNYINQKCPFSHQTIAEHKDPLTLKAIDSRVLSDEKEEPKKDKVVEVVVSRLAFYDYVKQRTIHDLKIKIPGYDGYTIEIASEGFLPRMKKIIDDMRALMFQRRPAQAIDAAKKELFASSSRRPTPQQSQQRNPANAAAARSSLSMLLSPTAPPLTPEPDRRAAPRRGR